MTEKCNKNYSRKCIVSGDVKPETELIRFDYNKSENIIRLDLKRELKGRGAYFTPTVSNWENIVKRRGLNKAFRTQVSQKTYETIEKELKEAKCLREIE
ncbi:YlxR family protein [Mycoplasmopsis felifaucium]|uniref:YlxR family protein n=1 Tax=Mycoplasmopsis felifaucium TaxID=35768 RepID=A0ABZ2RPX0_9BACT